MLKRRKAFFRDDYTTFIAGGMVRVPSVMVREKPGDCLEDVVSVAKEQENGDQNEINA